MFFFHFQPFYNTSTHGVYVLHWKYLGLKVVSTTNEKRHVGEVSKNSYHDTFGFQCIGYAHLVSNLTF